MKEETGGQAESNRESRAVVRKKSEMGGGELVDMSYNSKDLPL